MDEVPGKELVVGTELVTTGAGFVTGPEVTGAEVEAPGSRVTGETVTGA